MKLSGTVDHITYQNEENGFVIAKLLFEGQIITITGTLPALKVGEVVELLGQFQTHKQHGRQFVFTTFVTKQPEEVSAIQKYLESGLIKGIGKELACRIVAAFQEHTLEVIDQDPHLLSTIEGIGKKRIALIASYWQEQKAIRHVMLFLAKHNISQVYAQKIYRNYGDRTIEVLQSNPYILSKDLAGVGFIKADTIAKQFGIEQEDQKRIQAGIEFVLNEKGSSGHSCYPKALLIEESAALLGVESVFVERGLQTLLLDGCLIEQDGFVFQRMLFMQEAKISEHVGRILSARSKLRSFDAKAALNWVEETLQFKFAKSQQQAIEAAFIQKMLIITGGPGTGKTTIVKAILKVFEKLTKHIVLAAPTGKAAKRLSQMSQKKAFTLHSVLEWDFQKKGFKKNEQNPIQADLIIIDEASMIDTALMCAILQALPSRCRVLLVGDVDQLPSVGPGNVLKDLIASEQIKTIKLNKIFRQAKRSKIITNAHRVNAGIFPDLEQADDFFFIEQEDPEKISNEIESLHHRLYQKYGLDPKEEVQILSPMKKGVVGCDALNVKMQNHFKKSQVPFLEFGAKRFFEGDKVIQMRNNYDLNVFNGEIGIVKQVNPQIKELVVQFDFKQVLFEAKDLIDLNLAYCVSIHKYQGSECPCVIIPVHPSHFVLLTRNLLYTGMTRAKKMLILIGVKKAIAMCINNGDVRLRHTGLLAQLQRRSKALFEQGAYRQIDKADV